MKNKGHPEGNDQGESRSANFAELVEAAQKEGEKLTLAQLKQLVGLITIKTTVGLLIAIFTLISAAFSVGIFWNNHFSSSIGQPSVGPTVPPLRGKPLGSPKIRPVPYTGQPDWYSDHMFWLEREGDGDKKQGLVKGYELGEAEYTTTSPAISFWVVLHVPDTYEIASHSAFRLTTSGDRRLFERLEPVPEEDFRGLKISVPECGKGDKIIVLFRVESKVSGAPLDVSSIVKANLR